MERQARLTIVLLILLVGAKRGRAQWKYLKGPYQGTFNSLTISGGEIYAGTNGSGVYVSADSGKRWNHTGLTLHDVETVLCTGTSIFAGTSGMGIYASGDSGKSWSQINIGSFNYPVYSLAAFDGDLFAGNIHGDPSLDG